MKAGSLWQTASCSFRPLLFEVPVYPGPSLAPSSRMAERFVEFGLRLPPLEVRQTSLLTPYQGNPRVPPEPLTTVRTRIRIQCIRCHTGVSLTTSLLPSPNFQFTEGSLTNTKPTSFPKSILSTARRPSPKRTPFRTTRVTYASLKKILE